MAAVVIRDVRRYRGRGWQTSNDTVDLWLVWDDTAERDQLIALLQGKTYPSMEARSA
jgi:hypothetical protein